MPRFSIVIPIHKKMSQRAFFLDRAVQSVMEQSFKDYELIICQEGTMAENTNYGMKKSQGEFIKILYMDDYFAHTDSLRNISDALTPTTQWLATGCLHEDSSMDTLEEPHSPHLPSYSKDIHMGNNTIGSPSVITIRNEGKMLFDEQLSYLLDCDLYRRYFDAYGPPILLDDLNVVIGIHDGQTSTTMRVDEKLKEFNYLLDKYE